MRKNMKAKFAIAAAAVFSTTGGAMAASIGNMATQWGTQLNSIGRMAMILAALLGLVIAIMGLMKFRAHSANPNDPSNKLSSAFVLIFVGAAMIAVPALLGSGIETIFGTGATTTTGDFGLSIR